MSIGEKARNTLWSEVEELTDELLNKQPADDKWSIGQILEHLYLIESAFTRMVQKQLDTGGKIDAQDQPIELTVDRSYKVQAPKFLIPSEDTKNFEQLKEKLDSSHESLMNLAKTANAIELAEKGLPHPIFGHLNLIQAIDFVGYHEMRHIEQIKEVKEELGLLEKR